ncbi:hypothetical protein DFJ74DRAFT_770621 [Hyaloraphidium curvatum]|nr:hypothetical protein DFJ74DRAFT_770621 [Hyaloraphidium curvatum]
MANPGAVIVAFYISLPSGRFHALPPRHHLPDGRPKEDQLTDLFYDLLRGADNIERLLPRGDLLCCNCGKPAEGVLAYSSSGLNQDGGTVWQQHQIAACDMDEKHPCYREAQRRMDAFEDSSKSDDREPAVRSSDPCATCGKVPRKGKAPYKRCSKCLHVSYCNVDCQRADWRKHKAVCGMEDGSGSAN